MKKVRKNYSLEFMIRTFSLSEERGSVTQVAQELGFCKESIVNWRKLYRENKPSLDKKPPSDPIREELLRLRRELEDIRLERDILKRP